jgi:hypothetical protein
LGATNIRRGGFDKGEGEREIGVEKDVRVRLGGKLRRCRRIGE